MRLTNMKIGVRLAAGFCLLLVLMVSIIAVSVLEMKQINDKLELIVTVNNPQVELSYEMLDSVHVVSRVLRTIALLDDMNAKKAEMKKIDDARKKYNESEQKLEKLVNTEEGRAILVKAKRLKEESRSVNDRIMELAMANKREETVKALLQESQPKVAVWQDTLYELAEYAEERTRMRSEQARQSYETAFIIMMAIGGVSLALALLTAVLITRSITNPVSGLVKAATVASSGDLTADIKVDTKDEIGKLSGAFREMIDQMRELVRQIAEKAAAVSASSQQLNSSALQTSASANENASTMGEIATTVEQVTSNVQEISASSETAASQATEGNRGIVRVTDQMKVIAGASNEASEVLNGLNKKSQEISQIVELITSIADQTNLLALNAAIEAARAGDQGRGFAVVAEEVRKLAEQSASAAKEIYLLINAIQAESQKAVQSMAQGVREVEAGTEVVREVGDKFKEIIGAVEGLTSQIQEVASATEQMSAGVQNVAASTEEQTAAMEEVSASAESLSGLAEELNRLVSRFKV